MAAPNSSRPYPGPSLTSGGAPTGYTFMNQQSSSQSTRHLHNGLPNTSQPLTNALPPLQLLTGTAPNFNHGYHDTTTSRSDFSSSTLSTSSPYGPTAQTNHSNGFPSTNSNDSMSHSHNQQYASATRSFPIRTQLGQQPLPPFNAYSAHSSTPSPAHTSAPSMPRTIAPMPTRTDPAASSLIDSHGYLQQESQTPPTHVVGQQGRRGILPCDPDRQNALLVNTLNPQKVKNGQKGGPLPEKDADGLFPCEGCKRRYRHQKHLKRHQLRHNNIRPYVCGLCTDGFSRSDILKRHFTKCASRRGNPTNQSHLDHSRAHRSKQIKQEQDEEAARLDSNTPTATPNGDSTTYELPLHGSTFTATNQYADEFDFNALTINTPNNGDGSNQVSRTNSVRNSMISPGGHSHRTSLAMTHNSGYDSTGYATSTGHVTPDSVTTSGVTTPYQFGHENRSNPLSPLGDLRSLSNLDQLMASNRTPAASHYSYASTPQIVGDANGHSDWSNYQYPHGHDYSHSTHHSGTNTPLHREPKPIDFSTLPLEDMGYNHPQH